MHLIYGRYYIAVISGDNPSQKSNNVSSEKINAFYGAVLMYNIHNVVHVLLLRN